MTEDLAQRLIIGISSRALFDLDESNLLFEERGVEEYAKYQIQHENDILAPGVGFNLVKKLLQLNQFGPFVEIVLLSRNSPDTGLRIFNSIAHYELNITRAAFTSGQSPAEYIHAFGTHLFLSAHRLDVENALKADCAAALLFPSSNQDDHPKLLKIAFDGDAVIFDDGSERIFKQQGLEAFYKNEVTSANEPLGGGPFKGFLKALHRLQQSFPAESCPIRTALITARQAPAHERVIRTLRNWNIRIDEAVFLGGLRKLEFLQAFHADIFFDDQTSHCESASPYITTGHVPHGVANEKT